MLNNRRVLLTFVGKGRRSQVKRGYEQATYDFGDEHPQSAKVFGIALMRQLARSGKQPRALILVGTSGSDWDLFHEELLLTEGTADTDAILAEAARLADATRNNCVTTTETDPLEKRLGHVLGIECRCCVIQYGVTAAEQIEILRQLAETVSPGDQVTLDLTHGLRHLPMLGLVAALYFRAARRAKVEAVYYGALDLSSQNPKGWAPVLRLDGLLQIAEWIQALQTFDKDADYGPFVRLLKRDGVAENALRSLSHAAILERTAQVDHASRALRAFQRQVGDLDKLSGASALFGMTLSERIAWAGIPSLYARQRYQTFVHLQRRDLLRAALFGVEAFVTSIIEKFKIDMNNESPEDVFFGAVGAARGIAEAHRSPDENLLVSQGRAFGRLKSFRNAIAHVDNARADDVAQALAHPEETYNFLKSLLVTLLPATQTLELVPSDDGPID